jgi:hypothetical protein
MPGIFAYGVQTAGYRKFYNNTVDGLMSFGVKSGQTLSGTEVRNNIAATSNFTASGLTVSNNLTGDGQYVDRNARNYRLLPQSPAINAGMALPPYTDGFTGSAPDQGALEYNTPGFVAGALIRQTDVPTLNFSCTQDSGGATATCNIANLPLARKIPLDFKVQIGTASPSQNCLTTMNYTTHLGTAVCPGVPTGGQTGVQPILAQYPGGTMSPTGAIIDLGGGVVPPAPVLISPINGAITPLFPQYRWQAISGVSAYTITVVDMQSTQTVVNRTYPPTVCTGGTCSVTPSDPADRLTGNHTYAWYASAFGGGEWGPWSAPGLFLASVPPGQPTWISPSGIFVPNPPTLTPQYQWSKVDDTVLYYLVVFNLETFSLQFAQVFDYLANPSICSGTVCTVTPNVSGSTLINGVPYGVYVAALNYAGAGPWSAGVAFIPFVVPGIPVQGAPSGTQPSTPTYQWNKVQGATDYFISVLNSSGTQVFGQWVNSASTCATTPCQLQQPTALPVGAYSWFILSSNPAGMSAYSTGMSFSVTAPPSGPTATPPPAPTFVP